MDKLLLEESENKISIFKILFLLFILSYTTNSYGKVKIYYINGIQNTWEMAKNSKDTLENNLMNSTHKIDATVKFIFNPIGWYGDSDGADLDMDLQELFKSKSNEEKYYTNYEKILNPHNQSSDLSVEDATAIIAHIEEELDSINTVINKSIFEIDKFIEYSKIIIVAHSQGNLIANYIWANYVSRYGQEASKKIRIVNVANTASFSPNRLSFSHEGDAALFKKASFGIDKSLESLAIKKSWSRATPRCSGVCEFDVYSATFLSSNNGDSLNPVEANLDHGFVDTYMDDRSVEVKIDQGVNFISGTRFKDRLVDFIYAAYESLETYNKPPANMDFSTIGSHSSSLSYPNGSEEWIYGNNETVLWDTSQITGSTVDLYVLHDDPSDLEQNYQSYNYLLSIKNWYQFASNVSNTGSYTVDPDDLNGEGNRYIVLISSSNGNWDVSNRTFSLIPSSGGPGGSEGEVNIPNGGSGSSSGETGGGDTF